MGAAESAGKGGYSSMIKTGDFHVAALVEVNESFTNPGTTNQSIDFHKFNLEWILDGEPDAFREPAGLPGGLFISSGFATPDAPPWVEAGPSVPRVAGSAADAARG